MRRRDIHVVVAHAVTHHDFAARHRFQQRRVHRQRGVLHQQRIGPGQLRRQFVGRVAARDAHATVRHAQYLGFERSIGDDLAGDDSMKSFHRRAVFSGRSSTNSIRRARPLQWFGGRYRVQSATRDASPG